MIIIDKDLPNNCNECDFNDRGYCLAGSMVAKPNEELRPEGCPIKGVYYPFDNLESMIVEDKDA